MSNDIKNLTEVQRYDHYISVAQVQFCNRLENGNKSRSRGSSWTESIFIRATQLDGRLENRWIDEPSDNDMLECSAQDESDRNGSKVSMFLRCSGSGNWSVAVHRVQPIYHLATGYANPLNWHTTYALAYHFLRCKMTQQTYSLHAVYIILYKELLIYNFRHFPNFFTISFES